MHIAWTRHLLDNREFIVGGGTQPNTEPSRGEGLDGSATAEERDNYHRDAYENARCRRSSSRDPSSTPAICTSPASSARYISSARAQPAPARSLTCVPCPPPAARADRAQPPEPHTSPAAHQAGAAQAPDSAPPPQAPAATGSGGLKVTTHALHMSDHCIHLFLRRLARPALNSRAH